MFKQEPDQTGKMPFEKPKVLMAGAAGIVDDRDVGAIP
jgi:hypothetical protein